MHFEGWFPDQDLTFAFFKVPQETMNEKPFIAFLRTSGGCKEIDISIA